MVVVDIHSRNRLRQSEGRDEQASIERGIALVADVKVKNELPGIWKNRRECNRFCDSDKRYQTLACDQTPPVTDTGTYRRGSGNSPRRNSWAAGNLFGSRDESLLCVSTIFLWIRFLSYAGPSHRTIPVTYLHHKRLA